jgi:alpha-ketoglutarate-dependent taurine dioxygenase
LIPSQRLHYSRAVEAARRIDDAPYRLNEGDGSKLPLVIDAEGHTDVDRLIVWLRERADWVQEKLTRHGAILLRGFDVVDADGFEAVARAIAPTLRNDYLGTPTQRLTDYVFPSSDLPGRYSIAQHCEMSYLRTPPTRVFFGCLEPPAPHTGETPLADFRQVGRDLDPALRARFERGGIRISRNFRGPGAKGVRLWTLERWDEFFSTTDPVVVEAKCAAEGMDCEWTASGGLRLSITQPIYRDHPGTGERVWYNQFAAHHLASSAWEYPRIFRLRPTLCNWLSWQLVRITVGLKRRSPRSTLAYYCTYADGSEIPDRDMRALLATIWKHTVIMPWQRGDVLAIDNRSVSHGRFPCSGPRQIVACLA